MNYTKEQIRVGAEKAFILDLIVNRFPKGIVSYVADSFNLWDVITKILPTIKSEIMARDGKLVIRPDSGDPVDIICGTHLWENKEEWEEFNGKNSTIKSQGVEGEDWIKTTSEEMGVIELLWEIFGGTVNEQGYKVLDPHIGAIYGDSITPERQKQIYERLAAKGFAATNIILGIGSFSYQYNTRDTFGWAAKASWFEVETDSIKCYCGHTVICSCGEMDGKPYEKIKKSYNIYKDPVTDDGTKKSLKGLLQVIQTENPHVEENGEIWVKTECTPEEESKGLLQVIYEDGKFYNQTTLEEVRQRLIKQ